MHKYSIIIPTYNHLEDCLKPCLESIKEFTDEDIEVIVVANGCKDGTKEYVESLGKPFKLLWFEEGLGFTKATNEGIKESKGEYIIFLNNDTVLLKQDKNTWLKTLTDPLKDDVGVTGPLMQHCPFADRDFLIFFCAATRRDVIEKIGLLNEEYSPGGGEDTEFCIKAVDAGYKILQVPGDQLKHEPGMMVGTFPIYHKGEATMLDEEHSEEWHKVIDRNRKTLSKYKLPEGWFFPEDIKEYRRLVNKVPDGGTIGELGCYKGRSLCSIADLIIKKNLKVIVVDTFEGTVSERNPGDKPEDFLEEFKNNASRFGLNPEIYKGFTSDFPSKFDDKTFDLLFIDADHCYKSVQGDISDWESKVKGILAGHDFNSHRGVNQAVCERYDEFHVGGTIWSKTL